MQTLIDYIKGLLNIPYITEGDTVLNGCFAVEPFGVSALRANAGEVVSVSTHYSVELFFNSKEELLEASEALFRNINSINGYTSGPVYSFDRSSGFWQGVLNIEYLEV